MFGGCGCALPHYHYLPPDISNLHIVTCLVSVCVLLINFGRVCQFSWNSLTSISIFKDSYHTYVNIWGRTTVTLSDIESWYVVWWQTSLKNYWTKFRYCHPTLKHKTQCLNMKTVQKPDLLFDFMRYAIIDKHMKLSSGADDKHAYMWSLKCSCGYSLLSRWKYTKRNKKKSYYNRC
jgi:hypothetical protein